MPTCDVAIVGAGPYGLSAAAHLRAANGLNIRVFGEPMAFWERHMPKGMLLRSPLAGSHLSDPTRDLTLQAYQTVTGNEITAPLPLHRFTDYGRWFQSQVVPGTDPRKVELVQKNGAGFRLTMENGETWKARRVIIAAGIETFAWRPTEFQRIPSALVSHACDHRDLTLFAGTKVAVLGGGQSALESAALLNEIGAEVEVLVRAPFVRWLWRQKWFHTFRPVARLLYAPPDVGQAGLSHLCSAAQSVQTLASFHAGSSRESGLYALPGRSVVTSAMRTSPNQHWAYGHCGFFRRREGNSRIVRRHQAASRSRASCNWISRGHCSLSVSLKRTPANGPPSRRPSATRYRFSIIG